MGSAGNQFEDLQLVVLSGPSGVGKTTIVERLLARSPVRLISSISATTRSPRKNEQHGREYYFLTHDEFASRRERGEFLECAEVHSGGNWYGTLKSEVERARAAGGWALLEIDVQGAKSILRDYPQALTIFLRTNSVDDYERRLRDRGTESEEIIQRRLQTAREELAQAKLYRYQVINDDLDRAVGEIIQILSQWERKRHA